MKQAGRYYVLIGLAGFLCISTAESSSLSPTSVNGNWFFSAGYGLWWQSFNHSMTVPNGSGFAPPQDVDSYSTNNHGSQSALSLTTGYRWQRQSQWLPAYLFGVRYQHIFSNTISGNIDEYSLPQFTNYAYSWKYNLNIVSLYSQLDLAQYGRFSPYIDAGIGAAFAATSNYQETALAGVTPRTSPAYMENSGTQFAYNIGAGINISLAQQWLMSVGYDYQAFGTISSGSGQGTWSGTQLNLGNSKANTTLLTLMYLLK